MTLPRLHHPATRLLLLLAVTLGLTGCDRSQSYSQDTPEDVIRTARLMVERGDVAKLPDLLYADSKEMRALYRRLGVLLARMQDLGNSLKAAFPDDVAKMRAEAEAAAKEGRASSLLSAFSGQMRAQLTRPGTPGTPGPPASRGTGGPNPEQMFNDLAKQFFTDPFGFIEAGADKLSTAFINDDTVAILYEQQPIMPPIGLVMRRDQGKWYVVPPTNLPGISNVMPRTKDEFSIWASLIKIFDNAVADLDKDVRSRSLASLDDVARKAGEKAFIPAAMAFFAYTKAIEGRSKEQPAGR